MKTYPFSFHGDLLHEVGIFLAIRECDSRGHKILDSEAFAKKALLPCKPDLYISTEYHFTNNYGRRINGGKRYIIEVETSASKASILKKYSQYEETLKGVELIVIDLNEVNDPNNLIELAKHVAGCVP